MPRPKRSVLNDALVRAGAVAFLFGAGGEALLIAATEDPHPFLHAAVVLLAVSLFLALVFGFVLPSHRHAQALTEAAEQVGAARERLASMGSAVGVIAHDLRNSLATAHLIGERLALSEDPRVVAAAPRLERVLERAVALAEAARAYGRSEGQAPQVTATPLRHLVQACADQSGARAPDVEWRNRIDPAFVALVDPEFSKTVVASLFDNAARALSGRGGTVAISAERDGDQFALVIEDDGPGVPAHQVEHLFQPFAGGGPGLGLGLAVAREMARAQGGDLRLLRTGPGGAAFELRVRAA